VKSELSNPLTDPFDLDDGQSAQASYVTTTNAFNINKRTDALLQELAEQKKRMAQERQEHRLSLERRDLELKRHRQNAINYETEKDSLDTDLKALSSERDRLALKLVSQGYEIQRLQKVLEQKTHYAVTRQNALESINARIDSLHASIEEKEHIIDFQNRELARLASGNSNS